jgi:2'-5' RNA ligase
MRMFAALDIDDNIRERLIHFIGSVHGLAPKARWVRPESLHLTLKFIGERPEQLVSEIKRTLALVQAGKFELQVRGFGFFPGAKAPRVFWAGVTFGQELPSLAAAIDLQLAALGIPREEHAFSPHLTLARGPGRSGSPRSKKGKLDQTLFPLRDALDDAEQPEFGTMTASEFFLYRSEMLPGGSRYTKLERFPLQ